MRALPRLSDAAIGKSAEQKCKFFVSSLYFMYTMYTWRGISSFVYKRLVIKQLFLNIVIVKRIAAFRTELRRVCRILGLPSALVTFVKRCALRLLLAAFLAELTLIDLVALGAFPALLFVGLRCTAFGTELAGDYLVAIRALPGVGCRSCCAGGCCCGSCCLLGG